MTNILLVEDEPLIAEEIRQTLKPAGYEVINAFNSAAPDETAFATGVSAQIDDSHAAILLMDINLAGKFDGIEVGRRIRERSNIPVIFITGYSDPATLTRAIGTVPSGYLIKPISGRQLLAQIELTLKQNGSAKKREEHMEAQTGFWNLVVAENRVQCTFGWLTQFQYFRSEFNSFDDFRKIVHPEDIKALTTFLIECRTPDKIGMQIEYRLINAEGHERWILTKIIKIEPEAATIRISAINFDISDQKQNEIRLRYRATHDALTQLFNRSHFMTELQLHAGLQTQSRSYAVLFADLDKFKPINDEYGHAIGDRLLIEVSQRFQRAVKNADIVARFGGDEFVFLIKDLRSESDVHKIASRILTSLAEPVRIDGKTLRIGCSLGGAMNIPHDKKISAMLHDADVALYAAKKNQRDKFKLYEENDKSRVFAQLMTSEALRNALKQDQFIPYFHPIIRSGRKHIEGIDIEMHWDHPVHGLIRFQEFQEAAEDSGLIVPITLKIFEKILNLIRGSAATKDKDFVIVPLSRRLLFLRDWPTIVSMASEQFTEAGLNLIFEIEDASFRRLQNPETLNRLRMAGMCFSLRLKSLPQSFPALKDMPFQYFSIDPETDRDPKYAVKFRKLINESKKAVLARGANLKDTESLQSQCNYIGLRREFRLIKAREKKSNRGADTP